MTFLKTALVAFCLALISCNVASTPSNEAVTPITIGESYQLTSEVTGKTHEVNVWTPPGMKRSKSYPVLYVIDGGLDQDFQHIAGLAQLTSINGIFETPIVVGIRTSNRRHQLAARAQDKRYEPFNKRVKLKTDTQGADVFHNYIAKDVIPFIESRYPNSDRKIVIGESLAGYFITREFLRYPDTFTDYIAISPSLWWDDQRLAKEAPALLIEHDDTPRQIYFTMADEGGTMQAGLDKVMTAITARDFENLNMVYVDRRNSESHSTIYHGAALDALTQLFGIPATDYGPAPWYLREGGQPEEDEK